MDYLFGFDKLTDSELVKFLGLDVTGYDTLIRLGRSNATKNSHNIIQSATVWKTGVAYTPITLNKSYVK